ncbi:MAG: hypothetical protein MUC65_10135, partial [Pontiellaceae bacterium]|nr:hypothetical protein [Pontiellaceae bacterium]
QVSFRIKSFRSLSFGIGCIFLSVGIIYIVMYLDGKGVEWHPAFLFLGLFFGGIAMVVNSCRERFRLVRLNRIVERKGFPRQ